MAVTAEAVKALRERTGAGMMECKKALVETNGDLEAAAEAMRKSGLAKADKKAGRVAAEGVVVVERSADGKPAALVEVNSRDRLRRAREGLPGASPPTVARPRWPAQPADLDGAAGGEAALGRDGRRDAPRADRPHRREHRRAPLRDRAARDAPLATYLHGSRIGARRGDRGRRRARSATTSRCTSPRSTRSTCRPSDVPADQVAKEREIFIAQAAQDPQAAGQADGRCVVKATEGKLRKYLGEITLLGQPFVKDRTSRPWRSCCKGRPTPRCCASCATRSAPASRRSRRTSPPK
ncbi:MAG: elongation factor Ts [Chromatiales bacterium]|nr:elongation factor Ts [Chromatiales bacterium]